MKILEMMIKELERTGTETGNAARAAMRAKTVEEKEIANKKWSIKKSEWYRMHETIKAYYRNS